MLNKLNVVFNNNGFDTIKNNDKKKVLKRNNDLKFEYFLLIELSDLNDVLDSQQQYLKYLQESILEKEVDKNSTLLICLKSEKLPLPTEIYKKILEIEEDPYFFRKLVIPYTQEQIAFLDNPSEFTNIIKSISKFEDFKSSCKTKNLTSSEYEIVSQLYIKLPFFKLPTVSNTKNIILDEYKQSLNDNEKKVLKLLESITVDDIGINNDEFYKKLKEL